MFKVCCQSVVFFSALLISSGFSQSPEDNLHYRIRQGDNLWSLSSKYYADPLSYQALYEFNKEIFNNMWETAINTNPEVIRRYPQKMDYLIPGTTIILPVNLIWNNYYCHRDEAINLDVLNALIDSQVDISLKILSEAFNNTEEMAGSITLAEESVIDPFGDFLVVSTDNTTESRRKGNAPTWYMNPQTKFQKVAKLIGEHYKQTSYCDCLIIAKRIIDTYQDIDKALSKCNNLPKEIPFYLDVEKNN